MKIISKYFLRELVFPFFLALGIISFVLIMNQLIRLVDLKLKYGVGLWTIFKLVCYILPATFAITVPMSLLFAILLALGRMATDMELTALKAGGISLPGRFVPVLVLALGLSGLMLAFNEYVLPRANLDYKILFWDIVRSRSSALIQEGKYIRDFEGYVIHVGHKDKDSGRLENVTLFLLPKADTPLQLVNAAWGRLVSDPKSLRVVLELHQGVLQTLGRQDNIQLTQFFFDTDVMDLDIEGELSQARGVDRRPQEMPIREIIQHLKTLDPANPDRYSWEIEMDKKIAIPFACLAFALVGCPLGTMVRKGGRLLGFVLALGLIFDYYLLLSAGETYAANGRLPAWLAMWFPDMELGALGLYLNWIVLREKALIPKLFKFAF